MTATLTETLRELKGNAEPSTAVFLTHKGTPYRQIAIVFGVACQRAGLTDVTFHALRHTFASRLVMAGVDLPTVQALMGHKTMTMTMRYAHLAACRRDNAMANYKALRLVRSRPFVPEKPQERIRENPGA